MQTGHDHTSGVSGSNGFARIVEMDVHASRAARRAVFWVALVITFFFGIRRARLRFWLTTGLLLVVAVLFPLALGWESPLLLVPLCEALCVALLLILVFDGTRVALKRLAPVSPRLLTKLVAVVVE